jgi:cephalosporin hydroxylase
MTAVTPLTIPPLQPLTSSVAIDDATFAQLDQWELGNVLGTADHTFFGLRMTQHPYAVVKLNQLLNAIRPARIVEIGAGNAGLTVLFALYCAATGTQLHSYDIQDGTHHAQLAAMGYPISRKDVLTVEANVEEVRAIVAREGRTLIIADGGKAIEFNLLAPSMKVGDFICMHDFAPDAATFERDIKGKIWNWHEAWYDRVAEACAKHNIVHSPALNGVVWSLGWKRG